MRKEEDNGESFTEFSKGSSAEQGYKILRRMDRIETYMSSMSSSIEELRELKYIPLAMIETFATKNEFKTLEARYRPIERFFWGVIWSTVSAVGLIILGLALKNGAIIKW